MTQQVKGGGPDISSPCADGAAADLCLICELDYIDTGVMCQECKQWSDHQRLLAALDGGVFDKRSMP